MIREKEQRLALVCYGGVSLAIYMHGITKELWKLLRASEALASRPRANAARDGIEPSNGAQAQAQVLAQVQAQAAGEPAGALLESEAVWQALLQEIGRHTRLRVVCDVLAGASAGGINAVLLSNAITQGQSLEPLTEMWLEKGDVLTLLDPEARPQPAFTSRLARFYKEPVAWLAARHSESLASVDVPEVRAEVALKLASFVRSRWFKPPFSGQGLTTMLDEAMEAMEKGPLGPSLAPPTLPVNLFVTVTDYWGSTSELTLNSPPKVQEREHRRIFAFESPAITLVSTHMRSLSPAAQALQAGFRRAPVAERPALLLAARATASFPGAFPPASIKEVDVRLAETGRDWAGRAKFVQTQMAGDRPVEEMDLIDGGVLHNAPFEPAIEIVRSRPMHRQVDRRFVYIDPKPGFAEGPRIADTDPGFFTAMLRALADIPREQPIRESLEQIELLSVRARRMRRITDAMQADVDAAVNRAVGLGFFLLPATPARLARVRARLQAQAGREAGFAFGAYAQLKLHIVLDDSAQLIGEVANLSKGDVARIRQALFEAGQAREIFRHEEALGRNSESCGYTRFLKQLDLGFRLRRLRFFIRRLGEESAASIDPKEQASAEGLKAALHQAMRPFETRRSELTRQADPALLAAAKAVLDATTAAQRVEAGGALIDNLARALDLTLWDSEVDQVLVSAVGDADVGEKARRALMRAWLGYPFYDLAILPLAQEAAGDGFDELKVDRISPEDANALRAGGARACLKGWQLNAFAAFFSRSYRENDYLWGRLHAAERLVDIVCSSVPDVEIDRRFWKGALFEAILKAEAPRLQTIAPLFAELEESLAKWRAGTDTPTLLSAQTAQPQEADPLV